MPFDSRKKSLKSRDPRIDVLRGVSILVVLLLHFDIAYRLSQGFFASLFSAKAVNAFARNGNYGVTIFFVISGFLITSMALSRFGELKNVSLRAFYSFRFARIIPTLLLIIGIVTLLAFCGLSIFANKPGTASMGATVVSLLTFTHNVLMERFGYFNYCLNVLWSLSVEEMFYFTFPILCVLLRKDRLLVAFWSIFILVGPIERARFAHNEIVALYGYFSCFDGIAIGCIAAVLRARLRLRHLTRAATRRLFCCLAAVLIAFVYLYAPIMDTVVWGVSVMALAVGVILVVSDSRSGLLGETGRLNTMSKPIRWLGKNSYELYLFHVVVLAVMKTLVTRRALTFYTKPLWFALFLVLSAIAAGVVARFYSEPWNRFLRAKLSPKNG